MINIFVKVFKKSLLLSFVIAFTSSVNAKDISQTQLKQLMEPEQKSSIILLDVRSIEEFEEGHIADALNIPHKELESRIAELSGDINTQIVIYCRSGRRAEVAKQTLIKNGFNNLDHLIGDFNGWTNNNLPVVTGK